MSDKTRVVFLDSMRSPEAFRYGGKARNLWRLQEIGVTVPRGFCIACDCYTDLINSSPRVRQLMSTISSSDAPEEILHSASEIAASAEKYKLPRKLTDEISQALTRMEQLQGPGSHGYAVRSSATIEDGESISFAGQAETYLGVKGLQNILESVKKTWLSILSVHAILYLKSMGVSINEARMGVVVQEMVAPDISGVMFSANIVTSDRNQMLVESTWGLGEPLVSGDVIPDTYVLDKKTGSIVNRVLGSKEIMLEPSENDANGTVAHPTSTALREKYTLDDETLKRLLDMGLQIERGLGGPQDIEWCMKESQIIVLQARPITTLRCG